LLLLGHNGGDISSVRRIAPTGSDCCEVLNDELYAFRCEYDVGASSLYVPFSGEKCQLADIVHVDT
jgi:hypothetical protein